MRRNWTCCFTIYAIVSSFNLQHNDARTTLPSWSDKLNVICFLLYRPKSLCLKCHSFFFPRLRLRLRILSVFELPRLPPRFWPFFSNDRRQSSIHCHTAVEVVDRFSSSVCSWWWLPSIAILCKLVPPLYFLSLSWQEVWVDGSKVQKDWKVISWFYQRSWLQFTI